jgi:hypothetical protein
MKALSKIFIAILTLIIKMNYVTCNGSKGVTNLKTSHYFVSLRKNLQDVIKSGKERQTRRYNSLRVLFKIFFFVCEMHSRYPQICVHIFFLVAFRKIPKSDY